MRYRTRIQRIATMVAAAAVLTLPGWAPIGSAKAATVPLVGACGRAGRAGIGCNFVMADQRVIIGGASIADDTVDPSKLPPAPNPTLPPVPNPTLPPVPNPTLPPAPNPTLPPVPSAPAAGVALVIELRLVDPFGGPSTLLGRCTGSATCLSDLVLKQSIGSLLNCTLKSAPGNSVMACGAPGASQTPSAPDIAPVHCDGTVAANGAASCSTQFVVTDPRYISNIGTYANMIDLGSTGSLHTSWIDPKGKTIAAWDCVGLGLAGLDVATIPGLDGTPLSACKQTTATADTYATTDSGGAPAPQTFKVDVVSTTGTASRYHGGLTTGVCDTATGICTPDLGLL